MKKLWQKCLSISVLFSFGVVCLSGCQSLLGRSNETDESSTQTVPGLSAAKTALPMQTMLNGNIEFSFTNTPVFDQILWLPGSEVMRLIDCRDIQLTNRSLSCNYDDDQGNDKNALYQPFRTDYSINTTASEHRTSDFKTFLYNGEIYIPEKAMEDLTGDIFTYHQDTQILEITLAPIPAFQTDNALPYQQMVTKLPAELNDNRLAGLVSGFGNNHYTDADLIKMANSPFGWKWMSATINNQDWYEDDWTVPDFNMTDSYARYFQTLDQNGFLIIYNLIFKDKEFMGIDNREGQYSLRDPEQVQRYLDFVREVVTYFKGVVDVYEIWNESNIQNSPQYISVEDYISVVKQVYPIIKSIDPDAKVAIGMTTFYGTQDSQAYMDALVSSDAVQYADLITLHPFFWASPEFQADYYYNFPDLVSELKQKALQNGFDGEFWGSEGNYEAVDVVSDKQAYMIYPYSKIRANKYVQRINAMNIGLGLSGGSLGTSDNYWAMIAISRSGVLLSGVKPADTPISVSSDLSPLQMYSYEADMGSLFSYWFDGVASDEDQYSYSDITLGIADCTHVYAYDVITGFFQELKFEKIDGKIMLPNVIVEDYPIYLVVF